MIAASELTNLLIDLWQEEIRYSYWETHTIDIIEEKITFRFAATTGPTERDLLVTGIIKVLR